jgi:hypothetical protein
MSITITSHSVQNGDTVEIVYRLTDANQFDAVAVLDRDHREYARHHVHPLTETGQIRFKLAHGRSIRVCLAAWTKSPPTGYVESDYVDIHVPYPLDVEAVRVIVREELAARLAPTSVDEAVGRLKAEFMRQWALSMAEKGRISPDDAVTLNGMFDLRALATAILAGETLCA